MYHEASVPLIPRFNSNETTEYLQAQHRFEQLSSYAVLSILSKLTPVDSGFSDQVRAGVNTLTKRYREKELDITENSMVAFFLLGNRQNLGANYQNPEMCVIGRHDTFNPNAIVLWVKDYISDHPQLPWDHQTSGRACTIAMWAAIVLLLGGFVYMAVHGEQAAEQTPIVVPRPAPTPSVEPN